MEYWTESPTDKLVASIVKAVICIIIALLPVLVVITL